MGPCMYISEYPMHIYLLMISNEMHTDEPILSSVQLLASTIGLELT